MATFAALAARAALLLLVLGAATVTSVSSPGSAGPNALTEDKDCFGVFCVLPIDKTCGKLEDDVCATLEVTHEPGQSLDQTNTTKLQGKKVGWKVGLNRKSLKKVTYVQQSGTGCYKIFEGKMFTGNQMTLVGNIRHAHEGGWKIKSIDYDINCWSHGASLPAWVIGLAVVIVVIVGVIIVLVMYCRKNKEATRDLILRMTGTQDTPVKCDTCKGTVEDATK